MPEIVFNGSAGRLEGRFQAGPHRDSPIVLLLHPHPKHGGTMNNKVIYGLYRLFLEYQFTTFRFNFRGVGRSEGNYDNGEGELNDAATALDFLQTQYPSASNLWVCGFSFGAWIALQLLMRRPEISGFIAISPPANMYDFNFLAPCPVSGQIIQGTHDTIVEPASVDKMVNRLNMQRGIKMDYVHVPGADHFFTNHLNLLFKEVERYLEYATDQTKGRKIA